MKCTIGAISKFAAELLFWMFLAGMLIETELALQERTHSFAWTENAGFTESDKKLDNPNCGFYLIYGFTPTEEDGDFQTVVTKRLEKDERTLAMIQINLRNYTTGPISKQGLKNIEDIFVALEGLEKQYLIRFLYDWDGKNAETEPENVEIILNHMRQLEPVFQKYEDIIFVQQGLFIGNWGEMNGTKHLDSMQQLAEQLEAVTGESTYLSVRTPAQWRKITGAGEITEETMASSLVRRLGLYNDGMMGNEGDYGTYGTKSKSEAGLYSSWNRAEELAFQEELCKLVPNGGEVIVENPLNDFERAVENFEIMHVSYLNRDYDRNVLNKWADSIVKEDGCFDGMDGLNYMDRHLGYRILLDSSCLEYEFWNELLTIELTMKNVGFAPLYREPKTMMTLQNTATGKSYVFPLDANLRAMAGGTEAEQLYTIVKTISLKELEAGNYEAYVSIKDMASGSYIELANEQEMQKPGYKVGEIQVDAMPDLTKLRQEYFAPENIWKRFLGEER
ncbi:MAG: DUF4832 domain-containing protein [Lachnospiraceae bacterium]|nr:DUF4832 domain-containing protein [Lachnospiraceae bacterium]